MRSIGLLAWLAMVPMWAGEMPEKAADYHAALLKRPESAQLFERFRDAWLEERSTEELEKELLGRAEGSEAGAWAILARSYLAAGRTEQALAAFDKARSESPATWLSLETAGLRLAAKDFAAAEKDALAVPEGDPKRPDALKLAGLACLRAERIDEALAYWTQAVSAAPGDIGLLEDLTELTRREGRFDLALEYCGKWRDATQDAYGKAMATLRRSELLLGSQRFEEALAELAEVFKMSADDSWLEREAMSRAEQAHRQRGDTTGWATWIGAQAEAHPARLGFRRAHAQALAAAGKTDRALEVLTEVMRRTPGDSTVRWQRIALLEQSMKLSEAYEECAELAAKEPSETAGLRMAELAFRMEKMAEVKKALDGVMAAADSGKRVNLASLYARYGLPEESERIWRAEAGGELGGIALRQLAKHLKTAGREREAIDVWKQLGAREVAQDRIDAAQMLAAAGERGAAREILANGRAKFAAESGYEAAVADLAMVEGKADEARAIFLNRARAAKQSDDLAAAVKGWLRASAELPDPLNDLGEETADRCLRAAWLAAAGKPLPAVLAGDELERSTRQALLREHGRWAEVVSMMEAVPGERGPLLLSELAEAKSAAGDLPGALAVAQAWRARVPDQPGPWLFEAGILEKLHKPADATVLLRRAAARFEDNEDVARRLFSILQESLDSREPLEWAWKRHDRSGDESVRSGWLREILRVSKERDKLEDLQARFEERARRDPASPGPLVALAELAKARGDSRAELDLLRRAAVNAPREPAVLSTLAALEERSGESDRALERYQSLARLAPGPDSARQLAQAKIRLGDIEGGMRDLQAMAGEKGIDLRALEQSAGDLASRGYVEEAARMLQAVDPAQRNARLLFVLGMLLETDGREREAVDAFSQVMAEPEDPAERAQRAAYGYDSSPNRARQLLTIFQPSGGREQWIPGVFNGLQVPRSLVEAKMIVKSRLSRLAMQHGGESWTMAARTVPELSVATPEQWHQALEFFQTGESGQTPSWWDFIRDHPGNPLGVELLVETNQYSRGTSAQVAALLKTGPPLHIEMSLRWGRGVWLAENVEFLESIDPLALQDPAIRSQVLAMVEGMFLLATAEGADPPVTAAECSRGAAVLGKADFEESEASRLLLLKARLALLEDDTDQFIKHLNRWGAVARKSGHNPFSLYGSRVPIDALTHWRKQADDKAFEALIARIESPVLRCQLSRDADSGQRIARANRELAALPKDAPMQTRRALIQWKWSLFARGESLNPELRRELEAAVEDPDPLLSFHANLQLMSAARRNGELTEADRLQIQALLAKLSASPDPDDQAHAAQYAGYYGGSPRGSGMRNLPVVTRWGAGANFSPGYPSGNPLRLPAIIAMDDKDQSVREAARFLEGASRASAGRPQILREAVKKLSEAGLLSAALERISLPPDAGLGRQVAMMTLMDAAAQPERVRGLLGEIATSRPWETHWTVDLALRSTDDAEMRRLLDSVAERSDFDRTLGGLLAPPNQEDPGLLARLTRLIEWAPEAKGRRGWMEPAMTLMAKGGRGGMQGGEALFACFRRYVDLALDDRNLGELGFRMMHVVRRLETPETLTIAARRALLSGSYKSVDRTIVSSNSNREEMKLAALEHLVLEAATHGDEQAFPAEFRERLKAVDPASEAWIAGMLAAKTVDQLPEISNMDSKSAGWVVLARHEAAMLRAIKMPGRDPWLTGVFRKNHHLNLSENLRHVVRESLLEADKDGKLETRLLALLEASAGPRKTWNQQPERKNPPVEGNADQPAGGKLQLSQSATFILGSVANSPPTTLLAVMDFLREARVPVADAQRVFNQLAQVWRQKNQPPGKVALADLLGDRRSAPYTLGIWQFTGHVSGDPAFFWGLPELLRNDPMAGNEDWVKTVKENPDAGFLDLFLAWSGTKDQTLQRRAVIKAAPDLAKLPDGIRNTVLDVLTAGLGTADLKTLPAVAATRLRVNLDTARAQRMKVARQEYDSLKARPSANSSYEIGSMLGRVLSDDDAFVAEVLADWSPRAEADQSGNEIEAFMGGLISNSSAQRDMTMTHLRLLDSLSRGSPPPLQRTSRWGDLMENLWNRVGPQALNDPQFWREAAALSPKLQARFWLRGPEYSERGSFAVDAELIESIREAAKGGEVTRAALEWCLQGATMRRDREARIDGAALLGFAQALRDAGLPAESIATLLCRSCSLLPRMEDPRALMAATPALLEEVKNLSAVQSGAILQGIHNLGEQTQRDARKAAGDKSESAPPQLVAAGETAALLKFTFTRTHDRTRNSSFGRSLTPIVLATGDAGLFDLWIQFAGKSLVGDTDLVVELLEKDRIAEAVALVPATGRGSSSSRRFSSHLESLLKGMDPASAAQAFRLVAWLSLLPDAYGAEAPKEPLAARKTRLAAEFARVRDRLTPEDRAAFCLSLGLTGTFERKHVPALDEFANEAAANEFRKLLLTGERDSSAALQLFVPAVCSRVFADDLSGITLLTAAIAAVPPGPRSQSSEFQATIYPVHRCLAAYANRHDAKLPKASAEILLAYAKALAGRRNPLHLGIASQYVHLAATDPASLEADLKSTGLDGLQSPIYNATGGYSFTLETYQAMMRVALLHPVASEALLDSLGPPLNNGATTGALLPSLQDPKLHARISPALFLKWNSDLRSVAPKDLEAMNLYAAERRADFDEEQLAALDGLLERIERMSKAMPLDQRGMTHPMREEMLRRRQEHDQRLQEMRQRPQPR